MNPKKKFGRRDDDFGPAFLKSKVDFDETVRKMPLWMFVILYVGVILLVCAVGKYFFN